MFRLFLARLRSEEPPPPWGVMTGLGWLAAYLVLQLLAVALVVVLLAPVGPDGGVVVGATTFNLSAVLGGAATAFLLLSLLGRQTGGQTLAVLRIIGPARLSLWAVALFSLGVIIAIDLIPLAAGLVGLPVALDGLDGAGLFEWLLVAILLLLVLPVVETALAQGVLYPALAARFGNGWGILLTALAYTTLRAVLDSPDPLVWLQAFLAGLYLTAVRAHEGSTRPAIVARMVFGAFWLIKALWLFAA